MNNVANALDNFFLNPTEDSFAQLFTPVARQLTAFFRARRCRWDEAEDLAQEVLLKVYLKGSQLRDPEAFRGWLFKIASNALCDHYRKKTREIETVSLDSSRISTGFTAAGGLAFEFSRWMAFLDSSERDVMTLRFLEDLEYHEIAAVTNVPIGTIQWRVFNAKKKLAPRLAARKKGLYRAA